MYRYYVSPKLRLPRHDEHELATGLMGLEVGDDLLQRTAHALLMDLGDFTAGTHLTVGTEHLGVSSLSDNCSLLAVESETLFPNKPCDPDKDVLSGA